MASPTPEPFEISVSDELLDWINERVRTTRIPPGHTLPADKKWLHGVPVDTATKLHDYWVNHYDWRKIEASINADLQQYTLPITYNNEVHTVHFVHHRSSHPNAIPLLFIHGWPGSFLEVRPIINLLTNPAHPSQQAYHVIAPSLIGFGFSSYPSTTFSPIDQAHALHTLMLTLNYATYVVQGGDWGSIIARTIGLTHADSCPGVHVNMVAASPPSPVWQPWNFARMVLGFMGPLATAFEARMYERMLWWRKSEFGYAQIQGTKSQTIQYALADSPFGFVCWIMDKLEPLVDYEAGWTWRDEDVITLVMPYIINGSPGHAEIYRWSLDGTPELAEMTNLTFGKLLPKTSYFGASIFPRDAVYAAKWWAEATVAQNVVFWKEHEKGGHFASLEQPDLLVEDLRTFTGRIDEKTLGRLRSSGSGER